MSQNRISFQHSFLGIRTPVNILGLSGMSTTMRNDAKASVSIRAAKISMSPLPTEQNRNIQKYIRSFQKAYSLKLWAEYKQTEI